MSRFRIKQYGKDYAIVQMFVFDTLDGESTLIDRELNMSGSMERLLELRDEFNAAFDLPILETKTVDRWDPSLLGASGVPEDLKEGPQDDRK